MSDFCASWSLSRRRFLEEITGLNQEQLGFRLHERALTIGEMALHVAGVETYFGSQIAGTPLDGIDARIAATATEGVVDDGPFPFRPEEITPELVQDALRRSALIWEPLITVASAELRAVQLRSALGPMIDGEGAFTRLGFHAAYHQGQAYLIKNSPGFPTA